jgi:hypothetical protein
MSGEDGDLWIGDRHVSFIVMARDSRALGHLTLSIVDYLNCGFAR